MTAKNLKVENSGFELVPFTADEQNNTATPEYLRLRGYRIVNRSAKICEFTTAVDYRL